MATVSKRGVIASEGIESDGELYHFRFGVVEDVGGSTTLFVRSSLARQYIDKFIGHKVVFLVYNDDGMASEIGLLDENDQIIKV